MPRRLWFHARLIAIIALGLIGNVPSFTGTIIPFLLVLGQIALILSLIWTLIQRSRRKRQATKAIKSRLK